MRGLAALYVMIGHARFLLWEGYGFFKQHAGAYTKAGKALVYFFSLFRYGHEAVMFFFVLSGFVIHLKYAKKISGDPRASFDFPDYLKRRAERLYPPLLLAILITFILDSYGTASGLIAYSGNTPYEAVNAVNKDRSLLTLLGNLAWLQQTVVPEFGSDGPLWSLMYEWWFYMLYPVFFYVNRKSMRTAFLLAVLLCTASFAAPYIVLVTPVFRLFIYWYLGVVLADIYANRLPLKSGWPAAGILLVPVVLWAEEKIGHGFLPDLVLSLGFAALLYTLLTLSKKGKDFKLLKKLGWLGSCSYTLYVTHFPILFFFGALLMRKYNGYLPVSQLYIFAGIAVTLSFAYGMHFIVERPFTRKKPVAETVRRGAAI